MMARIGMAFLMSLGLAVTAQGQNTATQNRGTDNRQPATAGQATAGQATAGQAGAFQAHGQATAGKLDRHIASCLALGNHEEIALAEFAMQHAQNDQVRQFAQQMIQDHRKVLGQLQRFAPEAASMQLSAEAGAAGQQGRQGQAGQQGQRGQPGQAAGQARTESATDARQTAATSQSARERQTTANPATQQPGTSTAQSRDATSGARGREVPTSIERREGSDDQVAAGSYEHHLMALGKQTAEECLRLTKAELQRHTGEHFAQAYIGQQVGAHIGMLAQINASEQFASPELKQVLDQGRQITQQHMDHARQLMAQLEGKSGSQNRGQGQQRDATKSGAARSSSGNQ
ncbi:MAG: DUF4142 domain-containing protein [Pirellulaceae bacterium]